MRVTARMTVPDRDTGEEGLFEPVHHFSPLWDPSEVRLELEAWLEAVWLHEFYEGLNFDNKRVKEQH